MNLAPSKALAVRATEYDKAGQFQLALNVYLECIHSLEQNLSVAPLQKRGLISGLIARYKNRVMVLETLPGILPPERTLNVKRSQSAYATQSSREINAEDKNGNAQKCVDVAPRKQSYLNKQLSFVQNQHRCNPVKGGSKPIFENSRGSGKVPNFTVKVSSSTDKSVSSFPRLCKANTLSEISRSSSISNNSLQFHDTQLNYCKEKQTEELKPFDLKAFSFDSRLQNQVIGYVGKTLDEPIHSALYETGTDGDLIKAFLSLRENTNENQFSMERYISVFETFDPAKQRRTFCSSCYFPINNPSVTMNNNVYHQKCFQQLFRCTRCRKSFDGNYFAFKVIDGLPYHIHCSKLKQ